MKYDFFIFDVRPFPSKGAKNNRICQTSALMDRNNFDGMFVAFQTQLIYLELG